jgi:uncharacterized SAM-binding protein YcdF (DUF218 family)
MRTVRPAVWIVAGLIVAILAALPFADRFLCGSDSAERADAIVVLAGGSFTTGRLAEGLRLVEAGYATNLIVSGVEFDPHNRSFDRGAWELLQRSPAVNVTVDARSPITHDTARLVAALARQQRWRRVLVVTSAFHWRRTRVLFAYECPAALELRVCTVPDVDFGNWWARRPAARLVRNEYWFLATFLLFHTPYGLVAAGAVVLLAAVNRFAWRRRGRV